MNLPFRVPSPYVHPETDAIARAHTGTYTPYALAAWPAANRALYVPFWFPASCTLVDIRVAFGTATGNYDLGVYTWDFKRIEAKGSTAVSAAMHKLTLASPYRVPAGETLYAALVLSSASDTTWRIASVFTTALVAIGVVQEALGATALPATATPAAPAASYLPLFAYGVR